MAGWTLVTGGAGYVGSVLVSELLASGRAVRVVDALIHGGVRSLLSVWGSPKFEFFRVDVRDRAACRAALGGCSDIVHLAAIVGDPACSRDPELARETNLDATEALVGEAHNSGVERLVFLSTCSNYGKMADSRFASEDCELSPLSVYAETKVAAEQAVLSASGNGLSATCLRLATVYGPSPRMRFDLTVNEFTRDALLAGELVVYGEQFWRPYIHVRDAACAIRHVLDAPADSVESQVFNVGSTRENYRKVDIVEFLRARIPTANFRFVHRDEDPRDYRVSFRKLEETLGYEPWQTVPEGIDEIIGLLESRLLDDPYAKIFSN